MPIPFLQKDPKLQPKNLYLASDEKKTGRGLRYYLQLALITYRLKK